jgi:hypothetical protein
MNNIPAKLYKTHQRIKMCGLDLGDNGLGLACINFLMIAYINFLKTYFKVQYGVEL